MNVKVKRFDKSLPLPEYEPGAACFDLSCRESLIIPPQKVKLVPLNIAVKTPSGYALLVFVRSSTPMKKGLMAANSVGVIDPFYCGENDEVLIQLLNFTGQDVTVTKGEVLAQGMMIKTENVKWNEVDQMGEKGQGGYKIDWPE